MLADKSIFKEIKLQNRKCESFLDVVNYDQIKGKMDCLKFLSTPHAYDTMLLREQDFYHNNKEDTYDKIYNYSQTNKFLYKKISNNKVLHNFNSRKVSKHSMTDKNKIDSSTIIKLLDDKTLNKFFEKKVIEEKPIMLNNYLTHKTSKDILNYFINLAENGVRFQDVKKKIEFYEQRNHLQKFHNIKYKNETVKKIKEDNKKRDANYYKISKNKNKTNNSDLKKLTQDKENDSHIHDDSQLNSTKEKISHIKQNSRKKFSLHCERGSSSDNRMSNFFFTNPDIMTLSRKNTIKSIKLYDKDRKIIHDDSHVILPDKKILKKESKDYLNEIFVNTQTKEKFLLNESDIEDFYVLGNEKEKPIQIEFEKFLKLKNLENEIIKLAEPDTDKINENFKNVDKFIQSKFNTNSKIKMSHSKINTNKSYTINFKEKKLKLKNHQKNSEKLKNLFEKNTAELGKKDINKMIDYCHSKCKTDRNIIFNNLKDHYQKNQKVESVLNKLKGDYNTPADEYIKDITLQEYKSKGLFLYGEKQGHYMQDYIKLYGIEKDVMRLLNSIK